MCDLHSKSVRSKVSLSALRLTVYRAGQSLWQGSTGFERPKNSEAQHCTPALLSGDKQIRRNLIGLGQIYLQS
jgi:hypothetical protein